MRRHSSSLNSPTVWRTSASASSSSASRRWPIQLALGAVVPLQLLGDGGRVTAQPLDDAAQPDLVVGPHLLAHGVGRLVRGGVELGEPLLVLRPLLQERFDAVVGIRGHGLAFLSRQL